MSRLLVLGTVALSAACSLPSGTLPEANATTSPALEKPREAPLHARSDAGAATAPLCTPPGPARAEQVCWRWGCDAAEATAVHWNGDAPSCRAGDLDADAADRAVRRVNVHRFLAGVAPVVLEPGYAPAAQECALMAHANGKLSHTPPSDWSCWSPTGAAISAVSLVANRSAAPSVAAYFEDPLNEATMVHRRWLLSETLSALGVGTTDRYSCLVLDESAVPSRAWVAWPPPGPVPIGVFETEKLDESGWTIASDTDDLDAATVTISSAGEPMPLVVTALAARAGSRSAIRFVPQGWSTKVDRTYEVRVRGPVTIDFTVEPIGCPRTLG